MRVRVTVTRVLPGVYRPPANKSGMALPVEPRRTASELSRMRPLIEGLALVLAVVRPLVLVAAVATGVAALASWATHTRRLNPFSRIGRFARQQLDPLFAPAEKRLLLAGGQPAHAPWWTLGAVVVGGLLLISALQFVLGQLVAADMAAQGGVRGMVRLVAAWGLSIVQVAIMARVIASWVGGSPYKKWWRWAFVITDPILVPLRRVIPTIGPIDISPLVAYFGVAIVKGLLLNVL
jgi:YggT family protein